MARINEEFIDISSSADVKKAYGKSAGNGRQVPLKKMKSKLTLRIFSLILSIILLISGVVLVKWHDIIDMVNKKDVETRDYTELTYQPVSLDSSDVSSADMVKVQQPLSTDNVLNILLFGQDSHGDGESYGRSDTMILMSLDTKNKKIKLTSFQRDTYVSIPDHGANKINAAFSLGGEALAIETIESNFAIKIDKYATVDFDAFRKIISILGGVDIELTLDEIKYINAQIDVNDQTDRTSFLTYDESQETQMVHLDGYQALWYARNRGSDSLGGNPEYSFNGDDWDRTSRQRNLLNTIIKSLREKSSLDELVDIANSIGPYITTNLKNSDINSLLSNIGTYIKYDVEQLSVPTQDTWNYATTSDGQSIIYVNDVNQLRLDVARFVFGSDSVTQ